MVSQRRKQENGRVVNIFNFLLVALLLAAFALPSNVYAQCKTVKASTMSICAPSGWEVEIETDDEDSTASIYLKIMADDVYRSYFFNDYYTEEDETLDEFVEFFMKDQELIDYAKWSNVKKTSFQSHDARQVSGVTNHDENPLNITILFFNGSNEMYYSIFIASNEQIASLQNDEIVKSFRIVNSPASGGNASKCKTVKANTMSICVPSGWNVDTEIDDEDNTAYISLIEKTYVRTYDFMEWYTEANESLDEIIEFRMKMDDGLTKWSNVKKTSFQSRDARQVSGVSDVDGSPLNITLLVFNGGNEMCYGIYVVDVFSKIDSLQNDEIVKSFRIVNNDGRSCPGAATVTDIDNNTYNTVIIGKQCWMKENLRTTRYADGTTIPMGSKKSQTKAYRYAPDGNNNNVSKYGYLYNWPAVMHGAQSSESNPSGVQGICPDGWHVPSKAEWYQLTNYVRSQSEYVCGNTSFNIAKALASTEGWKSSDKNCAVGNNSSANNATGFSVLPAGEYRGSYDGFGQSDNFGIATRDHGNNIYSPAFNYRFDSVDLLIYTKGKSYGFSVRCVRN